MCLIIGFEYALLNLREEALKKMSFATTDKLKLAVVSILTSTIIMCLTIAGYASEYNWFQCTVSISGISYNFSFSLFNEKVSVLGTQSTVHNYVCKDNTSNCNEGQIDLARNAGNAALALSILLFLRSFAYLRIRSGFIAKMFGIIVALGNLAFIFCCVIALGSLATFVTDFLQVQSNDLKVASGAAAIVAALLLSLLVEVPIALAYSGLCAPWLGRYCTICEPAGAADGLAGQK